MVTTSGQSPPEAGVIGVRQILLGSGPRFARDAFGPVLAFYLAWKVAGLVVGIGVATLVGLVCWQWERRNERPGLMARLSVGVVIVQALIGLAANDAKAYLAPPVLITGVYGLVFVASALIGRPLAGAFAAEMYPFPPEVRSSVTFRAVFGRVSLVWGAFLLLRCVLRLITLSSLSVDEFVAVSFLTGAPLTAVLISWSVWYGRRGFERSREWGWAFAAGAEASPTPDDAPLRGTDSI